MNEHKEEICAIEEIYRLKKEFPRLNATQIHQHLVTDSFIPASVSVCAVQRFIKSLIVPGLNIADMRRAIDGLCAIVQDKLHMDPRCSALYLFCGKRCDRIKALLWEGDGFLLLYKRMEAQGRFRWPRNPEEVRALT